MKKLTKAEQKTLELLLSRAQANGQLTVPCTAAIPAVTDAVTATLNERGSRYGDFTDHAQLAQDLQYVLQGNLTTKRDIEINGLYRNLYVNYRFEQLDPAKRQALNVICDKIARVISGDPNYADNWHDIQGYAKLVEDRLPKEC